MLKTCVFDLDGTLAYTLESMWLPANEVLKHFGLKELPLDNFRYYCGDGATELVKRCLRDAGDPELRLLEDAERMYRKKFNADPMQGVTVYEGMREALSELKRLGASLAVCSNKPAEGAIKVVDVLYPGVFEAVIGQMEGIRRKPFPDTALLAAEKTGAQPEECMYIGDSSTDMETGHAAGMFTVGAVWGYRGRKELTDYGADALAERPGDLPEIFRSR